MASPALNEEQTSLHYYARQQCSRQWVHFIAAMFAEFEERVDPAEADQFLDHARAVAARHEPGDFHPLGSHVHRREVIELAAWPPSGRTPAGLPAGPGGRRGPATPLPEISTAERAMVFDHLRRVAETSGQDSLLRRQALYLQSYDRREDAAAWMADQYRSEPRRRSGWTANWPVTRTLAAAQVRHGDPAPLTDFADYGLADEPGHVANLNYWAYWTGEIPTVERVTCVLDSLRSLTYVAFVLGLTVSGMLGLCSSSWRSGRS